MEQAAFIVQKPARTISFISPLAGDSDRPRTPDERDDPRRAGRKVRVAPGGAADRNTRTEARVAPAGVHVLKNTKNTMKYCICIHDVKTHAGADEAICEKDLSRRNQFSCAASPTAQRW